jgi:hypothetical protein
MECIPLVFTHCFLSCNFDSNFFFCSYLGIFPNITYQPIGIICDLGLMSSSHAMCFTCLQAMSVKISLCSQLLWCCRRIKAFPLAHLALLPSQPFLWTTICLLECKLAFARVYEPTCDSTKLPTFKVALECEIICAFA